MKQGKLKRFLIDGKRKDDVKACDTLERDPDRFVYAEAEAAAAILSKREEKQKPKKVINSAQTDVTPVNIDNLKKKWGKWYFFGKTESGQHTAKCKACSSWYVGINKKQHSDGTPFKGYEYSKENVIKHGKQKLGWDGHLKDHKNKEYSNRAHWRAVRGLETQQKLLSDRSNNQQKRESSSSQLSSRTSTHKQEAAPRRIIGLRLNPSVRRVEREKRGLEVLARMAYITAKADMPISKFNILRNVVQQSQLTMLADSHSRVEAISIRLNDFFAAVETQISGLKTLVDTCLPKMKPKQNQLIGFHRAAKGNLGRNVMKNAINDLEEILRKQFGVIRKDIISSLTELLRDASHTSQRLATQGTTHGFTQHAFRRVFEAVRKQTLEEMQDARGWTFMLDESTDLTVTKQLLITVKYYHFSSKATRYRILDLIPLPDGKAETMLVAVWNLFQECVVDLNFCYGIGADGARVNQGEKGGFIKLFLNKLQILDPEDVEPEPNSKRWIPHIWCSSHVAALGSSAGNAICKLAAQFEEDMKNINADFTCSAVRIAALAGYQQMLSTTREKFLRITPWRECR